MRFVVLALAVTTVGCICPPDRRTETGFAPNAIYEAQIENCVIAGDCMPLCLNTFTDLDPGSFDGCRLTSRDGLGAFVEVHYHVDVCVYEDDGSYDDDGGYDDGDYGGDDGDYGDDDCGDCGDEDPPPDDDPPDDDPPPDDDDPPMEF